jgi:hypothetical protein
MDRTGLSLAALWIEQAHSPSRADLARCVFLSLASASSKYRRVSRLPCTEGYMEPEETRQRPTRRWRVMCRRSSPGSQPCVPRRYEDAAARGPRSTGATQLASPDASQPRSAFRRSAPRRIQALRPGTDPEPTPPSFPPSCEVEEQRQGDGDPRHRPAPAAAADARSSHPSPAARLLTLTAARGSARTSAASLAPGTLVKGAPRGAAGSPTSRSAPNGECPTTRRRRSAPTRSPRRRRREVKTLPRKLYNQERLKVAYASRGLKGPR